MRRFLFLLCGFVLTAHAELDAKSLVYNAMEQWRGTSSFAEMRMTIHRPDWERSMSLQSWTAGLDQSLILVTAPAKDKGNANLLNGNQLWTYSPKINRVIKIPSSMMNQSWLGSDLSNRDITKSTEILDQYAFTLISQYQQDGHTFYQIEATPMPDAPVVWGKEILTIRDDFVMHEQAFYDQDMVIVKTLNTLKIDNIDGRAVATYMRVSNAEKPDQWTDMEILNTQFNIELDDNTFTLTNLRSLAP